jgi:hypothetical protein
MATRFIESIQPRATTAEVVAGTTTGPPAVPSSVTDHVRGLTARMQPATATRRVSLGRLRLDLELPNDWEVEQHGQLPVATFKRMGPVAEKLRVTTDRKASCLAMVDLTEAEGDDPYRGITVSGVPPKWYRGVVSPRGGDNAVTLCLGLGDEGEIHLERLVSGSVSNADFSDIRDLLDALAAAWFTGAP